VADLLELAERCEQATRPDARIDDDIARLLGDEDFARGWPSAAYTASLDAAMTLVPEGWRVGQLEENWRSGRWHCHVTQRPSAKLIAAFDAGKTIGCESEEAEAATPALALTAAALRARAATARSET